MDERFVLVLGIRDPAQRGAETHTDTIMRCVGRISQATIFEGQFNRGHRELGIAVQPLQPMGRENLFWKPIQNFGGAGGLKN